MWVPSSWANALNFAVFDIILITLAFAFTADVTGRLNDSALRDGRPRQLYFLCPPLIGGGLCGTHAGRVHGMAAVRAAALLFALLSNLCIRGGSAASRVPMYARVLSPGSLRALTSLEFSEALITRAGCQSSAKDGSPVYGELRVEIGGAIDCVTDPLLLVRPVSFGVSLARVMLDTGRCVRHHRKRWSAAPNLTKVNELAELRCARATLACYVLEGAMLNMSCRGLVRSRDAIYLCENGAVVPESLPTKSLCRLVRNVNWKDSYWMDAMFFTPMPVSMLDAFHVMNAAGKVTKVVYRRIEKPFTTVKYLWAIVLSLKVALVGGVGVASLVLRRAGMRPVVNDERGLAELLRNGIDAATPCASSISLECSRSERSMRSERSVGSDIFLDIKESADGRKVVYVKGASNKDPNEELHKEEELYW